MQSTGAIRMISPAIFTLATALLIGCEIGEHPTKSQCASTEQAARTYYAAISGSDPDAKKFEFKFDEFSPGLAGYRIFDASGDPAGSMVIKKADCSLVLFDNLAIE